jgi:leucyl-tRNA synthetase
MSSKYNPQEIEPKWQGVWEKNKLHKADDEGKNKYYSLIEFPYPSGDGLHVGHVRSYTAMDIVARKRRMEGYNVLFPIGWDAFGLPTENYAIKTKTHPKDVTKTNTNTFRRQLKSLGFSFDWDREINTTDPEYYKWTQWMFLQFFEHGLTYKKNVPINWCLSCKIGLANEEVVNGKCERCGGEVEKRNKDQWLIKITEYAEKLLEGLKDVDYIPQAKLQQENWIGKSEGALLQFPISNSQFSIEVFTTRPDTLFGATYLVLSPEHSLLENNELGITNYEEVKKYVDKAKNKPEIERTAEDKDKTGVELKGVKAINPANKEEIPIFVADYVLVGYGTGAIMAVPAHDERDFEFSKKYNLNIRKVIEPVIIQESGPDAVRSDEKLIERDAVVAIIKHWSEDKYLCLKWKKLHWQGFVIGGIKDGEDVITTATREIEEETGYKNAKFVKKIDGVVHSKFYQFVKKVNRFAHFQGLYFELENEDHAEVADHELEIHDILWLTPEEVEEFLNVDDMRLIWDRLHEKSGVYTGEGILTNSGKFDGMDSEESKKKISKFVGGEEKIQYKLRDWVFSRQRYWGEPIPLIFCIKCEERIKNDELRTKEKFTEGELLNPGWFAVDEKVLPVELPDVENYEPTETGESPLASIDSWVNTTCPKCGGPAKRETDVMPNWAGSSWYYLRYCDPHNGKEFASMKKLKYWMGVDPVRSRARGKVASPKDRGAATSNGVDWYNGGMEHTVLHLLYSRFWNMFLHDIKKVPTSEPYKKRTSHGFILGEGGIKMSKSKGNVINPDSLVQEFGADSLRLYEMFIGPFNQTVAWDPRGILGPERFLRRVWEIQSRQMANKLTNESSLNNSRELFNEEDKELEGLLHRTIKKISEDIESMSFNTSISTLMVFANSCFEKESISKKTWETFLKILAPFAPHISEELYQLLENPDSQIRNPKFKSIHKEKWPKFDEKLAKEEAFELIVQINGKTRTTTNAPVGITESRAKELAEKQATKWLEGKEIKKVIFVADRLINLIV